MSFFDPTRLQSLKVSLKEVIILSIANIVRSVLLTVITLALAFTISYSMVIAQTTTPTPTPTTQTPGGAPATGHGG